MSRCQLLVLVHLDLRGQRRGGERREKRGAGRGTQATERFQQERKEGGRERVRAKEWEKELLWSLGGLVSDDSERGQHMMCDQAGLASRNRTGKKLIEVECYSESE